MLKLKNLCDVMDKKLTVDLWDPKRRTAYYYGAVTRVPKKYEDYTVVEIHRINIWECGIIITK